MTPSPGTLAPARAEIDARPGRRRPGGGGNGHHPTTTNEEGPPARADGVELLGPVGGSGYRRPPSLVRRADGQTFQLTPLLYYVLESIDGRRDYDAIASDLSVRISKQADAADIRFLVNERLRPLGVVRQPDGSQPTVRKMNPLLALRFRKVVTNPRVTRRITAPFAMLFKPQVAIPVLLAFAATTAWVFLEKGLASAAHHALYEPAMLLLVFALTTMSAGFHEFGHAAAARYEGATPGSMGIGLYLVWPVFYTDVTDTYRLSRRGRLRVDVGGLYFNAIFTVAVVAVWAVTGWDALLLLVPIQLLHMAHQLVPFVRFDGYHILADLTGVPDLFAHIKPTLLHLLPTRWGKREPGVLKPWVSAVVTLWVLLVIPLLGVALVLMVKVLPRLAATAWDSIGIRWDLLQDSWAHGNVVEGTLVVLSILALALPVLGISYLVGRVVRRTSMRVWRATARRPAVRGLAIVAAAVALALLAWSWWPNGQYRPIQAGESGALLDDGGPSATSEVGDLTLTDTALSQPVASASPRLALVLSPEGVPVTEQGPKEVVLLPAPGESPDEGTWPFPFDPPAHPDEGDNQALAVNTEDGSTVYDVAIAIVWVTEGPVDEVNEAWAVANCSDCNTLAVAFQSVFVVGQQEVITPQNIAVAVNYSCQSCQTEALAVQLITALTSMPSEEAMLELAEVWKDLESVERNIESLSLEQVQAELVVIEAAILQILLEDGALVVTDGTMAQASSAAVQSPAEATEQDAGAMASEATDDTSTEAPDDGTASDEASPPPSEEPSPSATAEPSPTPTAEPSPTPEASPTP